MYYVDETFFFSDKFQCFLEFSVAFVYGFRGLNNFLPKIESIDFKRPQKILEMPKFVKKLGLGKHNTTIFKNKAIGNFIQMQYLPMQFV